MSKTYSDAYALGQKDGESGENRIPARAFLRTLTNVGSYLPGAENRDDEWIKGYRQGFEDRVREVHVQYLTQGGSNMESGSNNSHLTGVEHFGTSGVGVGGNSNTFAYRIAVAQSLYERIVEIGSFLNQTDIDFGDLFARHNLLVGEFFDDLLEYHIKPRRIQLTELSRDIMTNDKNAIISIITKYQQAISGKALGEAKAAQYFGQVGLAAANKLSNFAATLGDGDPKNYSTQLAVAQGIRGVFEALLAQINETGKIYNSCAQNHDQLMLQDFNNFIVKNVEPRLQGLSDVWRAVNDKDLVGIDDVISRLKTVSSI